MDFGIRNKSKPEDVELSQENNSRFFTNSGINGLESQLSKPTRTINFLTDANEWKKVFISHYLIFGLYLLTLYYIFSNWIYTKQNLYSVPGYPNILWLFVAFYLIFPIIYSFLYFQRTELSRNRFDFFIRIVMFLLLGMLSIGIASLLAMIFLTPIIRLGYLNGFTTPVRILYNSLFSLGILYILSWIIYFSYPKRAKIRSKFVGIYLTVYRIYNRIWYRIKFRQELTKLNKAPAKEHTLKFISTVLPSLKTKIKEINPANLEEHFILILEENLPRLKLLFLYNKLPKISDKALLTFCLKVSSDLLVQLEEILKHHLNTQIYDQTIKLDDIFVKEELIWNQISKLWAQWESSKELSSK